jgi:AraC-like DNA-binding protein
MLVTTWNDTNILRHSLDLSRYCPHRDAAAPLQLALPGGELAIRRICSDPIRVIVFKASFHQPRFLCLEYLPQHVPMLVLSTSEDGRSATRMELLHAPAQQASLYWRAKQHSLYLLPMPGSIPLPDSAPLPHCPQSIALLQEWSGNEDNPPDILRKEQALWYSLRDELQLGPLFRPVPGNLLEGIRETGRYLFQQPASNDTISSLAKRAGMSATYLKTYFQQYYGLPIHRFRQYYRMQQACRLLHHTANGLSDIALQCGFRDDSNFIRAFQRYYGISPTRAFR